MHRLLLFIFPLALLVAGCSSEKQPDETIICIGSLGYNHKVEIDKDEYLRIPEFNLFLVHYHDSVFKIAIDTTGKQTCFLVRYKPTHWKIADSLFRSLGRKDQQIPLSEYRGSCTLDLICLWSSNRMNTLSGVDGKYDQFFIGISPRHTEEIPLRKLPSVVQAKFFEMEARYSRHYFSDRYYYKQFRTERVQRFS